MYNTLETCMIGKYKLYEKEPDKQDLDEMSEDELINFFGDYKNRETRASKRGDCINCDSENWYIWRTNSTLDRTYWFCTDCYQVKVKAATG